ncbi:lysophospholipid acyltransferase family protein [Sulfurimonas diazotrophicus]|uniref:Lysophospholipid acyltransferase family protein n=1 Tax=Sulfurimonas diazotrophicus TaxID=3131939 RepID=A0ABZ3HBE6_9BACT
MLNIEGTLHQEYPRFFHYPTAVRKPALSFLRLLLQEEKINHFLTDHRKVKNLAFIDTALEHLNISYKTDHHQIQNIPAIGKVIIVANHPMGAMDAFTLIKMVSSIRHDKKVKIIANKVLAAFDQISDLLIAVDTFNGRLTKESMKKVDEALRNEEAVIFFPAGEVSRAYLNGIVDSKWKSGFMKFAKRTQSPILPIHIKARNSMLFYGASWLYRPLATMLLAKEMFSARNSVVEFTVGEMIGIDTINDMPLSYKRHAKMMRKHLYRVSKGRKPLYPTQQCIAHPEPRHLIKEELKRAQHIGSTSDNKQIYLADFEEAPTLLNEVGRLREYSFRKVGEGSGRKRDLDRYDEYYRHLVLWDDDALEVVGAYRIADCEWVLSWGSKDALYLNELCSLGEAFEPYLENAIELGRSFIQPKYWGSRALDYLWQGIGAYLKHHPHIRYMIGPVSISGSYPSAAKEALVHFYGHYFGSRDALVTARTPYRLSALALEDEKARFCGDDYAEDFRRLKEYLRAFNVTVPTLYKQYAELCDEGGITFMDFGIDAEFNNCIDSYILVDVTKIKESKRKRYIDTE